MPKHARPQARLPRAQWFLLLVLTAAVASGSLFSTGCALVNTDSDTDQPTTGVTPTPTPTPTATATPTPTPTATATPTPTPTVPNSFTGPQQSSTIAISNDSRALVAVNPETNTVSVFDASAEPLVKLREVTVGIDPRSVAVMPNGTKAYVACTGGTSATSPGAVTVINLATGATTTINVAIEPQAVVISPNATRVYVANAVSNAIHVIDTATDTLNATITMPNTPDVTPGAASQPRALAVTNDGDADDLDETLYIATFFAARRPGKTGFDEAQDDQREGHVFQMNTGTNVINATPIVLAPLAAGFNSNGSTLDFVGTTNGVTTSGTNGTDPTNPAAFTTATTCYPNQLSSIALAPTPLTRAYVTSTAASPNGPFRFNVNVQGVVSMIDTSTNLEVRSGQLGTNSTTVQELPLNLNKRIQGTPAATRLFNSLPTAIAVRPFTAVAGTEAWIAIQTSNTVIRMQMDAASGTPTIGAPLATGPAITQVDLEAGAVAGRAPFGLCFNALGSRLYVNNFVSRSVTVVDPQAASIVASTASASQPVPGSLEETVQLGARLFFSGRENGAMSSEGWGACIACHPDGRADGVTWMFAAGPRQTIPLDGMFSKRASNDQRILNWSGIVDENADFENNSRGVSGGRGLISDDRQVILVGGFDTVSTLGAPSEISAPAAAGSTVNSTNSQVGGLPFPAIPPRALHAVATLPDGRVYIIGGQDFVSVDYSDIIELDPSTNTTRTRAATLGTPRHAHGAAAVQTTQGVRIYIFGGYDPAGNPVNTVEEYNPQTDAIRTVAALPFPVAEFGYCATQANNVNNNRDLIWVLGGNEGTEVSLNVTSTIMRFEPDPVGTGVWTQFQNFLPEPKAGLAAAPLLRLVTNSIFAIGGVDATGNATSTVAEIQIAAAAADGLPQPSLQAAPTALPFAIRNAAIGTSNNQILLFGGFAGTTAFDTVLQFNPGAQGAAPGALGRPSGTWTQVAQLPSAQSFGAASSPQPVNSFTPVASSLRDVRQDSINEWIKSKVRSHIAPNRAASGALATSIANGRTLFQTPQIDATNGVAGISCATCHGGNKWTRSTVSYSPPPSVTLAFGGSEQIIGAELRRTATQPGNGALNDHTGVLVNVGTFFAPTFESGNAAGIGGTVGLQGVTAGSQNEVRFNPADPADRITALGAAGFNIPSLISVASTAPYFHNGRAATLLEVLNGTADGSTSGGSALKSVHNVSNISGTDRTDLINFLKSIEDVTTPVP